MTKISVLYPNRKGARFDLLYYLDTHMPRSIELLSRHPGFKGVSVDRGAAGAEPGTDAPYVIMCHFLFDSQEDFLAAFTPHATTLARTGSRSPRTRLLPSTGSRDCALPCRFSPRENGF